MARNKRRPLISNFFSPLPKVNVRPQKSGLKSLLLLLLFSPSPSASARGVCVGAVSCCSATSAAELEVGDSTHEHEQQQQQQRAELQFTFFQRVMCRSRGVSGDLPSGKRCSFLPQRRQRGALEKSVGAAVTAAA